MIKVKVSTSNPQLSNLLLRQTPGYSGQWGSCQFVLNEPVEQCDWWFVCHDSALQETQTCICDPSHIVYISMEPRDLHPIGFYRQFSKLILCDPNVKHNSIYQRNGITWWAGINVGFNDGHQFSPQVNHDYDSLHSMAPPPEKLNRISIITSTKDLWPGHRDRLDFIEKLKRSSLSEKIDFYGHGYNPIADKLDAILPCRYHIALENTVLDHYWTEKIADAYLGYALPFYYGCANIGEYFPGGSFHRLDICSDCAISQLEAILDGDMYTECIPHIMAARKSVLDNYNLFALMASVANVNANRLRLCTLRPPGLRRPLARKALSGLKRIFQGCLP